jgi:NADPH-dependent 2,4-dienoyl-CoA reductase/sulfur reductase-like enzyme
MQTSVPGVYAAGDVASAFNPSAGRRLAVEHWQDAVDQGAVAGASAAGMPAKWDGVRVLDDGRRRHRRTTRGATVISTADYWSAKNSFTVWYEAQVRLSVCSPVTLTGITVLASVSSDPGRAGAPDG